VVFEPRQNEERVVGGSRGEQGMEGGVESEVGLEHECGVAGGCHLGSSGLDEEPLGLWGLRWSQVLILRVCGNMYL